MLKKKESLHVYRFQGYWRDVGTIDSLWDANMDMLSVEDGVHLFDEAWPIYARIPTQPPHYAGPEAKINHSLLTVGCQIDGEVDHSVLFHSVTVEPGASVRYSILMPGAVVKAGAKVEYSIIAEDAVIEAGAVVGGKPNGKDDWGIAVVAGGVTVGKKAKVAPAAMVTKNVKGGAKA